MEQRHPTLSHRDGICLLLIGMFYTATYLASVTLGYKIVQFGSFIYCGSVFIFPLLYLFGDILAEIYGYNITRCLIWFGLIVEVFFVVATYSIIHLPSPSTWHAQSHYDYVVGQFPHILFADSIAAVISSYGNAYAIIKWKKLLHGKYFWLRSIGANAIGEAIYTIIVNLIAFKGVVSLADTWNIVISDYLFKMIYCCLAVIPTSLLVAYLKKNFGNYQLNQSPIKKPIIKLID